MQLRKTYAKKNPNNSTILWYCVAYFVAGLTRNLFDVPSQMELMRFAARSHFAAPGESGKDKNEKSNTLRCQPEHGWMVGE